MSTADASSAAQRMDERRRAWAEGAAEAKLMDRERARGQSHEQRIAEGLALARIAEQLQGGRRERATR